MLPQPGLIRNGPYKTSFTNGIHSPIPILHICHLPGDAEDSAPTSRTPLGSPVDPDNDVSDIVRGTRKNAESLNRLSPLAL